MSDKGRNIRTALITGISGSGGSYLAEYISQNRPDVDVHGIVRWHSTTTNLNLQKIKKEVKVHECDLQDLSSVFRTLQQVNPDVIFHLAAHANVRASFDTPNTVLSNNILGTSNLLEAIRMTETDPIIQICSTSEVYGQVAPKYIPIKEDTPIRPASPYAVSKIAQDLLGQTYFVSYNMRIIVTRMFSYINPRRTDLFATSFARQVALIERGLQKKLVHGNLNSTRTLIDVRDAMRAYWDAVMYCDYGEVYNIGGITSMTVGEFLEKLISLSSVDIETSLDPSLLRPADVTLQVPCIDKFVQKTSWYPDYCFEDSLHHLLSYWRKEVDKKLDRIS